MTSPGPREGSRERAAAQLPRVEIVVVAHRPDDDLDELLRSMAAQGYPRSDLVVVASEPTEELAERVTAIVPDAIILDGSGTSGFGAAANLVLARKRAPLYLFCHDDIALAPDSLRLLVEELLRSNAGVAGPKLVDWDRPNVLRQVGLGADKLAMATSDVESGELDQEQHDAVRDVFAVPSACVLIRGDLVDALKGFDGSMSLVGEDIDLCWRAHIAGARVLVVPSAVVRHREALDVRKPSGELLTLARRHQLRTVLGGYGIMHSLRVVPQAALVTVIEVVVSLLSGRVGAAKASVGAWSWNLRHLPSLVAKRRRVAAARQLPDRELRDLQTPGFALLRTSLQGAAASTTGLRSTARRFTHGSHRTAAVAWLTVAVVLIIGSRGLISGGVPVLGDLVELRNGPRGELSRWLDSWQASGLGRDGSSPFAHLLAAIAGVVTLGQTGLLRTVLLLGMLPLGGFGLWRLLAPLSGARAQAVGLVTYLALPVAYDALAHGSLAGLVSYGLAPWLLGRLSVASAAEDDSAEDSASRARPLVLEVLGFGVVLALGVSAAPALVPVALLVALGLLLGSAIAPTPLRTGRLLATLGGGIGVAVALHLPWVVDALRSNDVEAAFLGSGGSIGDGVGLDSLLRLSTGQFGFSWLGWALVAAGFTGLLLGTGVRWAWAVRGWTLYVLGVALAWVIERGWAPFATPRAEAPLAVSAVGLAVAVAMGAASIEVDLRRYRFGWRQLVPFTAVAALVLGLLPVLGESVSGRWDVAQHDYLSSLERRGTGEDRVLWVGHDDVIAAATVSFRGDTGLAVTAGFDVGIAELRAVPDDGLGLVSAALATAVDGDTSRLGRLLAPLGIRYVAVVERVAAWPDESLIVPADPETVRTLDAQLDLLSRVEQPGLRLYENESFVPFAATLPADGFLGESIGDVLAAEPVVATALAPDDGSPPTYRGSYSADEALWLAVPDGTRWQADASTALVREAGLGWAKRYTADSAGEVTARHTTSAAHRVVMLGQALLWVLALLAGGVGRDRWRDARSAGIDSAVVS